MRALELAPADLSLHVDRGIALMETAQYREGLEELTAAAEQGDATAEAELGRYNMTGIPGILAPDSKKGIDWLRKSAAQGNPAAIQNLKLALGRRRKALTSGTTTFEK
jgi:TPR repeat protein